MNEEILKILAAIQEGENVFQGPEHGNTFYQMDTDFVSQADALKFGSKIMVPLTDEEGQKSYVSLPDAIDQLDSKGTLDLFKALYRSEIDNAESEASIVRDLTVVTGEEYEGISLEDANGATSAPSVVFEHMQLDVMEEADGERTQFTIESKYLCGEHGVVFINGKQVEGVSWETAGDTPYYGRFTVGEDYIPMEGDKLTVYGPAFNKDGRAKALKAFDEKANEFIEAENTKIASNDDAYNQYEETADLAIKAAKEQIANQEAEETVIAESAAKAKDDCASADNEADASKAKKDAVGLYADWRAIGLDIKTAKASLALIEDAKKAAEASKNDIEELCQNAIAEVETAQEISNEEREALENWPEGDVA